MIMRNSFAFLSLIFVLVFVVPTHSFAVQKYGTMTDPRDGKVYKTVKIGSQTWMAENLNFKNFRSKCYQNDERNCNVYGRLYEQGYVNDNCPLGWHVPSLVEWNVMIALVGGSFSAGNALKSKYGWMNGGNGSDDFGFSVLPSGFGKNDDYNNGSKDRFAAFWSTGTNYDYFGLFLSYYNDKIEFGSQNFSSELKLSIRCVLNDFSQSSSSVKSSNLTFFPIVPVTKPADESLEKGENLLRDSRDGQIYRTVTIGNQTWMAENLNYQTENSFCSFMECFRNGRKYSWSDAQNACPAGWHLPTNVEWQSLITTVGGPDSARKLMSKDWKLWKLYDITVATDEYGFSARAINSYDDAVFWSATGKNDSAAYRMVVRCESYTRGESPVIHTDECYKQRACLEKYVHDSFSSFSDQSFSQHPIRCIRGEIPKNDSSKIFSDSINLGSFDCAKYEKFYSDYPFGYPSDSFEDDF